MKKFAGIKNISRFATNSNTTSGITRRNLSGIFCTLLIIISVSTPVYGCNIHTAHRVKGNGKAITDSDFGSVPPCGALMRPLLVEWSSTGKAEPIFIFCPQRTSKMSMNRSRQDCSNGITTPHKTRTPTKRDSSTKSTERLLKQLTDKVITLQRDNEEKCRKSFGYSKNVRMFAATSTIPSGITRSLLLGIFYALLTIFGSVTPCGALMRPLLGKSGSQREMQNRFSFSASRTNLAVMTSTEKDCSNGITTPHKTRTPPRNEGKLLTEVKQLQQQLEMTRAISDEETRLKNSCFLFLIAKGLYNEYHEWLRKRTTREVIESIKKSLL